MSCVYPFAIVFLGNKHTFLRREGTFEAVYSYVRLSLVSYETYKGYGRLYTVRLVRCCDGGVAGRAQRSRYRGKMKGRKRKWSEEEE